MTFLAVIETVYLPAFAVASLALAGFAGFTAIMDTASARRLAHASRAAGARPTDDEPQCEFDATQAQVLARFDDLQRYVTERAA